MKTKLNHNAKRFARYLCRTYKNKIVALLLIASGVVSWSICGDLEVLLIMTVVCLPLFLTKKNYIH